MNHVTGEAWNQARLSLEDRWRNIVSAIVRRDEPRVLELVNGMDEFCDLAMVECALRESSSGTGSGPPDEAVIAGNRCFFCRAFSEAGGCTGAVSAVDRAVLAGDWDKARLAAESYLRRVEVKRFDDPVPSSGGSGRVDRSRAK